MNKILALLTGYILCCAPLLAMEPIDNLSWIKKDNNNDLQLAFKTYKNKKNEHITVTLLALIHAAEESFYKSVDEKLCGYKVLYEDMYSSSQEYEKQKIQSKKIIEENCFGDDIRDLFILNQKIAPDTANAIKTIALSLGLSFQLDTLNYKKALKMIHADIESDENINNDVAKRFEEVGIYQESRKNIPRIHDINKETNLTYPNDVMDLEELKSILCDCQLSLEFLKNNKQIIMMPINNEDMNEIRKNIFSSVKESLKIKEMQLDEKEKLHKYDRNSLMKDIIEMNKKHDKECLCLENKSCKQKYVHELMKFDERNKIALYKLDELLKQESISNNSESKIAITYGASHLDVIEEYLLNNGFELIEEEWHTAIKSSLK